MMGGGGGMRGLVKRRGEMRRGRANHGARWAVSRWSLVRVEIGSCFIWDRIEGSVSGG